MNRTDSAKLREFVVPSGRQFWLGIALAQDELALREAAPTREFFSKEAHALTYIRHGQFDVRVYAATFIIVCRAGEVLLIKGGDDDTYDVVNAQLPLRKHANGCYRGKWVLQSDDQVVFSVPELLEAVDPSRLARLLKTGGLKDLLSMLDLDIPVQVHVVGQPIHVPLEPVEAAVTEPAAHEVNAVEPVWDDFDLLGNISNQASSDEEEPVDSMETPIEALVSEPMELELSSIESLDSEDLWWSGEACQSAALQGWIDKHEEVLSQAPGIQDSLRALDASLLHHRPTAQPSQDNCETLALATSRMLESSLTGAAAAQRRAFVSVISDLSLSGYDENGALSALSNSLSNVLENLHIPEDIRDTYRRLLPSRPKFRFGPFSIAGRQDPNSAASWWLAYALSPTRLLVVIGEAVRPRHEGNAVLVGMVRGALDVARMEFGADIGPERVLGLLNRTLATVDALMTAVAVIVDAESANFSMANAAHPEPLIVGDNKATPVVGAGKQLGASPSLVVQHVSQPLAADHSLVMCTASIAQVESGGKRLGHAQLRSWIEGAPTRPRSLIKKVWADAFLDQSSGHCMVVIRRMPTV